MTGVQTCALPILSFSTVSSFGVVSFDDEAAGAEDFLNRLSRAAAFRTRNFSNISVGVNKLLKGFFAGMTDELIQRH